jgi:serine/threonine-protein kinase RsbW
LNTQTERKFKRSYEELGKIFHFVEEFSTPHRIQKQTIHDVSLAVEELFTNMVKYNPDGPAEIKVELRIKDNLFEIRLFDREAKPYDITKSQVYDLNRPAEERPIGKLGIHFVKNIMDVIDYKHNNEQTVITMKKNLGERNVQRHHQRR